MICKLHQSFCLILIFLFAMSCTNPTNETESDSAGQAAAHQQAYFFIGTYTKKEGHVDGKGKGLYVYDYETFNRFKEIQVTEGLVNPSFFTISNDGKKLYAVSETGPDMGPSGSVNAYSIDPETKTLTFINKQSSHSFVPCHISVDSKNRLAFVANYVGGVVAVLPIQKDGALAAASQIIQLKGKLPEQKPEDSHPHAVVLSPDEQFAYVPDLGADKVMIFKIDYEKGELIPASQPFVELTDGAGPRHFTFHPNEKWAYVINELNNTITSFSFNKKEGNLEILKNTPTLPDGYEGKSYTADIHISPDGQFLYGSNRGHDSIVCFKIDQNDGSLQLIEHEPTRGKFPRNFMIAPDGKKLYVANQNTGNITVFEVEKNGALNYQIQFLVPSPVCLKSM